MKYHRQELYIGEQAQETIKQSSIAIIGLGALGSPSAELLARSGIGRLILIDRDVIEESNLQRQTLFTEEDVDKAKASCAKKRLEAINSSIEIEAYDVDLSVKNISELIPENTNLILDCTDNLNTRFLLNDYAKKHKIPWIYSGAIEERGSVLSIKPEEACFLCVHKGAQSQDTCDTVGVLNTITSLIASIAVSESLKILLDKKEKQTFIHINLATNTFETYTVKKNNDCPCCQGNYLFLDSLDSKQISHFCSSGYYQIPLENVDLNDLEEKLSKHDEVKNLGNCLKFKNMLIFSDRCLIKEESEEQAKTTVSRYIGY